MLHKFQASTSITIDSSMFLLRQKKTPSGISHSRFRVVHQCCMRRRLVADRIPVKSVFPVSFLVAGETSCGTPKTQRIQNEIFVSDFSICSISMAPPSSNACNHSRLISSLQCQIKSKQKVSRRFPFCLQTEQKKIRG